jgi:hypothetical protein
MRRADSSRVAALLVAFVGSADVLAGRSSPQAKPAKTKTVAIGKASLAVEKTALLAIP